MLKHNEKHSAKHDILMDNFSLKDNIFLPLVLSGMDYK